MFQEITALLQSLARTIALWLIVFIVFFIALASGTLFELGVIIALAGTGYAVYLLILAIHDLTEHKRTLAIVSFVILGLSYAIGSTAYAWLWLGTIVAGKALYLYVVLRVQALYREYTAQRKRNKTIAQRNNQRTKAIQHSINAQRKRNKSTDPFYSDLWE